jgi:hypothetical protein
MHNKLLSLALFTITIITVSSCNAQETYLGRNSIVSAHPRILLIKGDEKNLKNNILTDKTLNEVQQVIINETDKIINLSSSQRILIGRRLLDKSRECLHRLFFLSYCYRMTGEQRYLKKANEELLAVCAFDDWNPSHFLDVAEITTAVSIAYDWLYNDLSSIDRNIVKSAILIKGLQPSLDPKFNEWLKWTNNWNQVCNTGMAYGALAIYEDNPELAKTILNRSIGSIKLAMSTYEPNGNFPEGYSYWNYGTAFNVMLISALQKAFGTDFGLKNLPGFLETAHYMENMTGPTNQSFNYSDSFEPSSDLLDVSMFWFANQLSDPSLLYVECGYLQNNAPSTYANNRLLPALMLWANRKNLKSFVEPKDKMWIGKGNNPVAMMRTSWSDKNAIYVGIKAGTPNANHGHMDIGSFVMDANGERWAMDLGGSDYTSLEAKGINIWDMSQTSQRWDVFGYNNSSHNTLTVNNTHQDVSGNATFINSSPNPGFMNIVANLTSAYKSLLSTSTRGIAIVNRQYVVVRDEISAIQSETTVRWTMATPAIINILSDREAELSINGKKMIVKILEPQNVVIKTWKADQNNYLLGPVNKNANFIGFDLQLQNTNLTPITVLLIPENSKPQNIDDKVPNIKNWPK